MRQFNDTYVFAALGTGAAASFRLIGGTYAVHVVAASWGGGNATLQRLAPDGSTWTTVATASANVFTSLNLPPGVYRVNVTTTTGVYAEAVRIPQE